MTAIDQIQLNFNPASLITLNIVLALVMFGIALDLRLSAFQAVLRSPRAPVIGLFAQFVLLPAFTYLVVRLIEPHPSVALGMMLVAACPGGNLSNFFTHLSGGNTALSVSMTAVSSALAVFFTPFNLAFFSSMYEPTASILREVNLDSLDMFINVLLILGLPLVLGLLVSHRLPKIALVLKKPFRYISLTFFVLFVLAALAANWDNFLSHIHLVAGLVFLHNLVALLSGYGLAFLTKLPAYDRRAITVEVGIQNSGLGLTLIFNFFGGMGGMALIAAWWGIWHIISGLFLSAIWSRTPLPETKEHF
ncbi:MAG: bile acid:sodium symporter family protein [Spirochaetales bacterium]|nr:bile acid:sodium symporter family protein [Spirochaetales bacterium]